MATLLTIDGLNDAAENFGRFKLESDINSTSEEIKDFIGHMEADKKVLVEAIEKLLIKFTHDIDQIDTENKAKLTYFLMSNHERFIRNLLSDSSLLDKLNPIIDEIVEQYGKSELSSSSGTFDKKLLIDGIREICERSTALAVADPGSENRDLLPSMNIQRTTTVQKESNEKNITENKNSLINDVRGAIGKGTAGKDTSSSIFLNSIPVFITHGLYDRLRQNHLRTTSMITQLLGISTVTTQVSNQLMSERGRSMRYANTIWKKIANDPLNFDFGKDFKEHHKIIYGVVTGFKFAYNIYFWDSIRRSIFNWGKKYTKKWLKGLLGAALLNSVPLLNGQIFAVFSKRLPRQIAKWTMVGLKVLGGIYGMFWFIAKNLYGLTKKVLRLVATPLKKMVRILFKIIKTPWLMVGLGFLVGKLISSLFDYDFKNHKFGNKFEREVTGEMTKIQKLGSKGMFSYIQNELDFIDAVFHALSDFFDLMRPNKENIVGKKLGYTDKNKPNENDKFFSVYDFTLKGLITMNKLFFDENSPLKTMFVDLFNKIYTTMNVETLIADKEDIFLNSLGMARNEFDSLQETINYVMVIVKDFIGGFAFRQGMSIGFNIFSKIPMSGWGKLISIAAGGLGGLIFGLAGKAAATAYMNSEIADVSSDKDKIERRRRKYEGSAASVKSRVGASLILRNLQVGSKEIESSLKYKGKSEEEKKIMSAGQSAEKALRGMVATYGLKSKDYYDEGTDNTRARDFKKLLDDVGIDKIAGKVIRRIEDFAVRPGLDPGTPMFNDDEAEWTLFRKEHRDATVEDKKFNFDKLIINSDGSISFGKTDSIGLDTPIPSNFDKWYANTEDYNDDNHKDKSSDPFVRYNVYKLFKLLYLQNLKRLYGQGDIDIDTFIQLYNDDSEGSVTWELMKTFFNEFSRQYFPNLSGSKDTFYISDKSLKNLDTAVFDKELRGTFSKSIFGKQMDKFREQYQRNPSNSLNATKIVNMIFTPQFQDELMGISPNISKIKDLEKSMMTTVNQMIMSNPILTPDYFRDKNLTETFQNFIRALYLDRANASDIRVAVEFGNLTFGDIIPAFDAATLSANMVKYDQYIEENGKNFWKEIQEEHDKLQQRLEEQIAAESSGIDNEKETIDLLTEAVENAPTVAVDGVGGDYPQNPDAEQSLEDAANGRY